MGLLHTCRRCGFKGTTFQKFVNHLWGQDHQSVSRCSFLKWSDGENKRSLLIYAPEPPYPLPSEILDLFDNLDVDDDDVTLTTVDFVCWVERPQNFIIQFGSRQEVEKVMELMTNNPGRLAFKGVKLGLRRKNEVADFEWPGLIGAGTAQNGSSSESNAVIIELSDDSEPSDTEMNGASSNQNGSSSNGNGTAIQSSSGSRSEPMDTDEQGEASTNGEVQSIDEPITIESKISDEFREKFLEKVKQQDKTSIKDDKKAVKKNLLKLQTHWLDVYVDFHNKLWPLCFLMSNRSLKVNRNEVGFEAKFSCECMNSKHNDWLGRTCKKEKLDEKVDEFLKLITGVADASKRLDSISDSKVNILKFKCHIVVSFSDSGNTFARMKLEHIRGTDVHRKMKIVQRVFKRLFLEFERDQINNWSPVVKKEKESNRQKNTSNTSWTEIEIVTLD